MSVLRKIWASTQALPAIRSSSRALSLRPHSTLPQSEPSPVVFDDDLMTAVPNISQNQNQLDDIIEVHFRAPGYPTDYDLQANEHVIWSHSGAPVASNFTETTATNKTSTFSVQVAPPTALRNRNFFQEPTTIGTDTHRSADFNTDYDLQANDHLVH